MILFIDTEFDGDDLLSVALVNRSGLSFYRELYYDKTPSEWVARNVIPKLEGRMMARTVVQSDLYSFLNKFKTIHLIADWPSDIVHFCNLLITKPGVRIDTPPLTMEIRRDISSSKALNPHHALYDAIALSEAYAALKSRGSI